MRTGRRLPLLAALVAVSLQLYAQAPAPQAPVLGRIAFPNSGAPSAQPAFIRGVLLLHSFEYDEAIAAFREAQRVDPSFAMAYWGEALSYNQPLWYNENLEKARAALARLGPTPAGRQQKAPTPREQGYLDAVERLFGDGSKSVRDRAYADRMAALSRANPADDEAAAFYALALLATIPNGSRDTAISLKAGAIATAILKRNPEHPGAAHYALHAYDDGEHAAMALDAARLYAKIAPASSHARHMPSHAFLPLGKWDEAAASDESAYRVSVDRARAKGLSASQYDFHSLSWLHYEYLQQGRFSKARKLTTIVDAADNEIAEIGRTKASAADTMPHHVESEIGRGSGPLSLRRERASMRARFVVESERWDVMKGQGSFDDVDELFALGLASVALGDRGRVEAALDQLRAARDAAPDADNKALAEIMYRQIAGLHAMASGRRDEGLSMLASAADLEAARPKPIARPYPIKPAGELYAEALLSAGDAARAVQIYQRALARTPGRAASLIGLARALKASGQSAQSARIARQLVAMWHLADADEPRLAEAKALAR